MVTGNRDKERAMGSVELVRTRRGQLPAPVFFEPLGCEANAVLQGKGAGTKNPESLTHIDWIIGGHALHTVGVDVEAAASDARDSIPDPAQETQSRAIHTRRGSSV